MSREAKEGVDFLFDLYAIVDAPPDAPPDELRHAINERTKEYHPDRLEGLAPEFQTRGARMTELLIRARRILLDEERRAEYDSILREWDGPVSTNGMPNVAIDRAWQLEMAAQPPEVIESVFTESIIPKIEAMTGYSPSLLTFLEGLIDEKEGSGGTIDDTLRAQYEGALLQQSRALALEESQRSEVLGLPPIQDEGYVAALGYAETIDERIEAARANQMQQMRMRAVGGVAARLALLAGEVVESDEADEVGETAALLPQSYAIGLPAFFEDQAAKVAALARQREVVTEKRLLNLMPTYPEAALQTDFREDVVVGVNGVWFGMKVDAETRDIDVDMDLVSGDIQALLADGDFRTIIERGFNVLTFQIPLHIDMEDCVRIALGRYIDKYNSRGDDQ